MNSDRTAGAWKQIKGKLKERWGKLTDDEIDQLEGRGEQLAGKLQEKYGLARDEAELHERSDRVLDPVIECVLEGALGRPCQAGFPAAPRGQASRARRATAP